MSIFKYPYSDLCQFLMQLEYASYSLLDEIIEKMKPHLTVERLKKMEDVLSKRTNAITVMIENIYQPQNASAIIRSCEAMGIQSIHIAEKTNIFQTSPQVVMGADKWVDIYYAPHAGRSKAALASSSAGTADSIAFSTSKTSECSNKLQPKNSTLNMYQNLHNKGYKIVATCWCKDAIPIQEIETDQPLALVFGTELEGLTQEAIDNADIRAYIPMLGFTQSFNVSVAAAISLHFLREKMEKTYPKNIPLSLKQYKRVLISWLIKSIRLGPDIVKPFFTHPELNKPPKNT